MKKEQRYGKISFWKFMFCLLITALHVGELYPESPWVFKAGSIGVEFFFLVSGYFFAKKFIYYENSKNLGEETFEFLKSKILKFFPYILILILVACPFCFIAYHYTLTDYTRAFYRLFAIPNYFKGNIEYEIFGINWYLMVLIITESILVPFLIKYKKNFVYIISPIITILIANYLVINYDHLVGPWIPTPFGIKGLLRGFMLINLGMYLYVLSEKFNNIKYTKFSKIILLITELLGYLSVFYLVNISKAHQKFDILIVIIFSICIVISSNKDLLLTKFSNNKIFYYLEKLSLPMYIYQWLIIDIMKELLIKLRITISYPLMLLLCVLANIFFGIITIEIVKLYNKNKSKIKNIFIIN